jgi:hypothetical protein
MADIIPNSSNIQPDFVMQNEEASISGYLYKKTRDGRWQKRWFETNGVYLTYYKSRKMEKLLAAVSLPQVGEIKTLPSNQDSSENLTGLFCLELNTRNYVLRAKSDEEAQTWVKALNTLRQEGITQSILHQTENNLSKETTVEIENVVKNNDTNLDNNQSSNPNVTWIKSGKFCCGFC